MVSNHAATRFWLAVIAANVIIAVVQDCIRTGRPLSDAQGTLALLNDPRKSARRPWMRFAAAIGCALAITAMLIWWVVG